MKNFRAADKSHAGGDEKHDINFHWPYLSNLYRKCFKNGFLLKLLANTDFVYTVSEAIAGVAKPQRNRVKDIADSSEASKKLKNRQFLGFFRSKFGFLAQNLTNSNREK
jgi:hypothetical protein